MLTGWNWQSYERAISDMQALNPSTQKVGLVCPLSVPNLKAYTGTGSWKPMAKNIRYQPFCQPYLNKYIIIARWSLHCSVNSSKHNKTNRCSDFCHHSMITTWRVKSSHLGLIRFWKTFLLWDGISGPVFIWLSTRDRMNDSQEEWWILEAIFFQKQVTWL